MQIPHCGLFVVAVSGNTSGSSGVHARDSLVGTQANRLRLPFKSLGVVPVETLLTVRAATGETTHRQHACRPGGACGIAGLEPGPVEA